MLPMQVNHTRAVSVVIPALSEGENLVDTVSAVRSNSGSLDPEVIVVDDGSKDGAPQRVNQRFNNDESVRIIDGPGEGIARARNAGACAATGEIIVFLDGHCYVPDGWLEPLIAPFANKQVALTGPAFTSIREPRAVACGVTWTHPSLTNVWLGPHTRGPVPFHIGACQAVRSKTFARINGFDQGMTRWGSEDIELCLRLWLLGYEVHAAPESLVYHLFRKSRPYPVDNSLVLYNHLRLALLHFDEKRLQLILAQFLRTRGADAAMAKACSNGVAIERQKLFQQRTRDITWLFDRFAIGF